MSRVYPCVYCTEDGYCEKYSDEEVTSWCVQSPCKDEKSSNADRIRQMSDEKLAERFYLFLCVHVLDDKVICKDDGCKKCWMRWLREEAK